MVKRIVNQASPNKITDPRVYEDRTTVGNKTAIDLQELESDLTMKELENYLNQVFTEYTVKLKEKK